MKYHVALFLLFLLPIKTFAQGKPLWEQYYEEITSVDDVDNDSWANMYDALNELATNKININKATKEDLEQLPFLSDNQIQDLLEYIHRHKRMQTLGELILIKSISWQERRLLTTSIWQERNNHYTHYSFLHTKRR